ncbi:exonuclease SbcCD subunit D [Methanoculleus sp. FWC-SCC1]|uniref:Exonuclease SbcCD subunit D n=1 Tax=Methanoculleus frigidifontis TaxID=2584085 RepID=A0ABT8M7N4_9EURY|nr:exonuclease SbcCD subunit D [Methanoculleus sp. FWC-SCC1]MDN7023935.1 exonuclease SbcCD subunit D [Methanoculleus sp. FWC-SCC1]
MKIVHIADTHLGLSAFNKIDPETGMNLRERLIYDNFLAAIDRIVCLRPDVLVHAGDLFHQVKPKTRAYTTVLEALRRLDEAGIPFVVIAGNHSMAKTRYTTSPLEVLEYHTADVHAAYRHRYHRVELGDTVFHLIPNMLQVSGYRAAFEEIEPGPGHNVLVTHGLASALKEKRLHTVAEHEIDTTMLSEEFDYIALGHFHGQSQVADNAWYSGSVEFCTYGEIRDAKGGLLVDLAGGSVEHIDLPRTPMHDLGRVACDGRTANEILEGILDLVPEEGIPARSMCQITLDGVRRDTLRALDQRRLNEARSRLLDLKFRILAAEESSPILRERTLVGVDYVLEFERFVENLHLGQKQEEYVKREGADVLRSVIARHREVDDASP